MGACECPAGPRLGSEPAWMPGKSGRAVGDWIEQCRPETKIIYLSGCTDNAIAHHGVLEPGTTFLQKPFTSDVLIRTIREALS